MIRHKIQQHTNNIYNLSNKKYSIKVVNARTLLKPSRFDLFAKLFYIVNKKVDYQKALEVYSAHIKAFNPDFKEPGRTDKNSISDFVNTFDDLILQFSKSEFNSDISVIPVDSDGVILDGAHRVSVLAFYNKTVTIAQFENTFAKCPFNFEYFKKRGVKWKILNLIALEMCNWLNNIHIACIWPKIGSTASVNNVISLLDNDFGIGYIYKEVISLSSFIDFIKNVYLGQEWTKNYTAVKDKAIKCFSYNKNTTFVIFENNKGLSYVIDRKDQIRELFTFEKHSIHISDNKTETYEIANLIFNETSIWRKNTNRNTSYKFLREIKEQIYYVKNIYWLNLKIKIASIYNQLKG